MRALALAALALATLAARPAHAHDVRGEVVFVDAGDGAVELELQVPAAQLAMARHQDERALAATPPAVLAADVAATVALRARDGRPFALAVAPVGPGGSVLEFHVRATPPPGADARWFELADELVLRTVTNANVYVFLRRDLRAGVLGDDAPSLLGALHYQARTLVVDRSAGTAWTGLGAAFHLGLRHIREGTDHLMFLLALLVVAPLVARDRRWRAAPDLRRGLVRTAAIATAFTLGHSLTLALGALAGLQLPSALVESAIAASILVTAIHAWRPRFAGQEPWIAAAFGLVHGLAFSTALAGFGFDGGSLALALLGFNLGVEAMQLVAIALVVPSLLALARTAGYAIVRVATAALAAVAALAWLAERALGVVTPVPRLVDALGHHGLWLAGGLAALVVGAAARRYFSLQIAVDSHVPPSSGCSGE